MHKVFLGTACFLFSALSLHAQSPLEKGLQSINRTSAEAIVEFLPMTNCKDAKQACTVHDWLPAIWHPA